LARPAPRAHLQGPALRPGPDQGGVDRSPANGDKTVTITTKCTAQATRPTGPSPGLEDRYLGAARLGREPDPVLRDPPSTGTSLS